MRRLTAVEDRNRWLEMALYGVEGESVSQKSFCADDLAVGLSYSSATEMAALEECWLNSEGEVYRVAGSMMILKLKGWVALNVALLAERSLDLQECREGYYLPRDRPKRLFPPLRSDVVAARGCGVKLSQRCVASLSLFHTWTPPFIIPTEGNRRAVRSMLELEIEGAQTKRDPAV